MPKKIIARKLQKDPRYIRATIENMEKDFQEKISSIKIYLTPLFLALILDTDFFQKNRSPVNTSHKIKYNYFLCI